MEGVPRMLHRVHKHKAELWRLLHRILWVQVAEKSRKNYEGEIC